MNTITRREFFNRTIGAAVAIAVAPAVEKRLLYRPSPAHIVFWQGGLRGGGKSRALTYQMLKDACDKLSIYERPIISMIDP